MKLNVIGRLAALAFAVALASPAAAADKLTIVLDWFVNPDHARWSSRWKTGISRMPALMSS